MPIAQLNRSASLPCSQSSVEKTFGGELLHQVNLVAQQDDNGNKILDEDGKPKDPRGAITRLGPKLGMSAAEIDQARKSTGLVVCTGQNGVAPMAGSGTLYGNGMQLVTNTHILIDEQGRSRKPCYFQNQDGKNSVSVDLDLGRSKTFRTSASDFNDDVALVRLSQKIPGAKGYPIDGSRRLIGNEKMIVISAKQNRMKETVPADEPVVQQCRAKEVGLSDTGMTVVQGDCSMTHGASGSVGFVRVNGRLIIKVIMAGGADPDNDNKPFKAFKPGASNWANSEASFSFGFGVDSDFARKVIAFEAGSGNDTARASSPAQAKMAEGTDI